MKTHPCDVIKYCLRCGSRDFKTNDRGHSFNCGKCHFKYFINNAAAVACLIFNDEGKLLLTRRAMDPSKGMLDLPGGFVEPDESAESAIIREIWEELGVKVTKAEYLVSFPNEYVYSGISVFTLDLAFICVVDDLSGVVPADDVLSIEYILPGEIKTEELCSESMANIIGQYIDKYPRLY